MKSFKNGLFAAISAFAIPSYAGAEMVQWPGNGHWYEVVSSDTTMTWTEARDDAASRGGYLASIGSEAENEFVFGLIDDDEFWLFGEAPFVTAAWGPWLGGYQQQGSVEPAGDWTWLSGEPWGYTNWDTGQPDNNGGIEHYLHFHSVDGVRAATWNDFVRRDEYPQIGPHAYVIEFVPEPSSFALMFVGSLAICYGVYRRRFGLLTR